MTRYMPGTVLVHRIVHSTSLHICLARCAAKLWLATSSFAVGTIPTSVVECVKVIIKPLSNTSSSGLGESTCSSKGGSRDAVAFLRDVS